MGDVFALQLLIIYTVVHTGDKIGLLGCCLFMLDDRCFIPSVYTGLIVINVVSELVVPSVSR